MRMLAWGKRVPTLRPSVLSRPRASEHASTFKCWIASRYDLRRLAECWRLHEGRQLVSPLPVISSTLKTGRWASLRFRFPQAVLGRPQEPT